MHEIAKYNNVVGVHDLLIHNYGPRKTLASIHVEVSCNISLIELTETIDKAKRIFLKI